MNYKEQIEDYIKYNFPKYFFNGKHYGFDRGKKAVTANTFLMYIGSRIASLKEQGVETNELVGLWSYACQQVILSAHKNIEIAKDFRSKDKHSLSPELNAAWDEVFRRELKIHNAKSINELDEKDLINKTYTQFLIYISSAIKNCELLPVNDQIRNDLELLKKECQNQYCSAKPTIELLSEAELFNQCQSKKTYWDYLDCYPYGEFSKKAKRANNKKENILITILVVILIIVIGFFIWALFIHRDWRESLCYLVAGFLLGIGISFRNKIIDIFFGD